MSQKDVDNLYRMLASLTRMVEAHIKKSDDHIDADKVWKDEMKPIFDAIPELAGLADFIKTGNKNISWISWLASKWKELSIIGITSWGFIKFLSNLLK